MEGEFYKEGEKNNETKPRSVPGFGICASTYRKSFSHRGRGSASLLSLPRLHVQGMNEGSISLAGLMAVWR